ncbi:hypothetical protein BDZ97DRAFT_499436 [Flammula alnicola]|nr:hypothetical protein BDZ97DRAFT_499436 [Flammula alnicola]
MHRVLTWTDHSKHLQYRSTALTTHESIRTVHLLIPVFSLLPSAYLLTFLYHHVPIHLFLTSLLFLRFEWSSPPCISLDILSSTIINPSILDSIRKRLNLSSHIPFFLIYYGLPRLGVFSSILSCILCFRGEER